MTKEQLAVYAKEKMYAAMGEVIAQSTTVLSLSEVLVLMGIPELTKIADKIADLEEQD
jgi:hypothetical protein